MKILVTGMTDNQAIPNYYEKSRLKVIPSNISLVAALKDMGHDVDQRPVVIGESLDQYDEVVVSLRTPSGFAYSFYNALWAISEKPDCILAHDDWQIKEIETELARTATKDNLFRPFLIDNSKYIPELDKLKTYEKEFRKAIDIIGARKNRMMLSAFAGGDLTLLFPESTRVCPYDNDRLFQWNPNPYHIHRQPKPEVWDEEKEDTFNFAGLVQGKTKIWLDKQNIEATGWKLRKYGSKKEKQTRVTEDNMMTLYAQHWGILMAGYDHAGSGWWRARPCQVADAGSILIGDLKEMMIYYHDERLAGVTPTQVAAMTLEEKIQFAQDQKEALYKAHPLDKSVQQAEIQKVLDAEKVKA